MLEVPVTMVHVPGLYIGPSINNFDELLTASQLVEILFTSNLKTKHTRREVPLPRSAWPDVAHYVVRGCAQVGAGPNDAEPNSQGTLDDILWWKGALCQSLHEPRHFAQLAFGICVALFCRISAENAIAPQLDVLSRLCRSEDKEGTRDTLQTKKSTFAGVLKRAMHFLLDDSKGPALLCPLALSSKHLVRSYLHGDGERSIEPIPPTIVVHRSPLRPLRCHRSPGVGWINCGNSCFVAACLNVIFLTSALHPLVCQAVFNTLPSGDDSCSEEPLDFLPSVGMEKRLKNPQSTGENVEPDNWTQTEDDSFATLPVMRLGLSESHDACKWPISLVRGKLLAGQGGLFLWQLCRCLIGAHMSDAPYLHPGLLVAASPIGAQGSQEDVFELLQWILNLLEACTLADQNGKLTRALSRSLSAACLGAAKLSSDTGVSFTDDKTPSVGGTERYPAELPDSPVARLFRPAICSFLRCGHCHRQSVHVGNLQSIILSLEADALPRINSEAPEEGQSTAEIASLDRLALERMTVPQPRFRRLTSVGTTSVYSLQSETSSVTTRDSSLSEVSTEAQEVSSTTPPSERDGANSGAPATTIGSNSRVGDEFEEERETPSATSTLGDYAGGVGSNRLGYFADQYLSVSSLARQDARTALRDPYDHFQSSKGEFFSMEPPETLAEVLNRFLGFERLPDYTCDCDEGCGRTGNASRHIFLARLPPILIVVLNRFRHSASGVLTKICKPVVLSRYLAIPALADVEAARGFARVRRDVNSEGSLVPRESPSDDESTLESWDPVITYDIYELYSVIIHCGTSTNSGHYKVVGKPSGHVGLDNDVLGRALGGRIEGTESNLWYLMDDSRVREVDMQEALRHLSSEDRETPYLLFLHRIGGIEGSNLSCCSSWKGGFLNSPQCLGSSSLQTLIGKLKSLTSEDRGTAASSSDDEAGLSNSFADALRGPYPVGERLSSEPVASDSNRGSYSRGSTRIHSVQVTARSPPVPTSPLNHEQTPDSFGVEPASVGFVAPLQLVMETMLSNFLLSLNLSTETPPAFSH